MKTFVGIETGGTKFVCATGDGTGKIDNRIKIPTSTPEETMSKVMDYLREVDAKQQVSAIGIATFGPIDDNPISPYYGCITASLKPGWRYFNMVQAVRKEFDVPIGFDTDVNGAALGEYRWGNGQGFDSLVYWTVGTGINAGSIFSGVISHTMGNPEVGHTFIPHDKERDPFEGVCPYHKDCLEGLASGPALQKRWNVKSAMDLSPDHPAWDLEAEYLAYAMANCIVTIMPERIIVGGGVMQQQSLYSKIRKKTQDVLKGYIKRKRILDEIEDYIVPPLMQGKQGVAGGIALAERALRKRNWE